MPGTKTELIKINATKPEPSRIRSAARYIKNGGLVVFPTETVYGIGANALDENACARIFEVKGRPRDNPLIVHVDSLKTALGIGRIPSKYLKTIEKVWPSPITFIVKARVSLPDEVTAGLDTVAIRMPAHPVALSLIRESGVPVAAPSANPSKKPSATNAEQAIGYFNGKVDCVIDAGRAFFGVESTIINLEDFALLRPGPFTSEEIERIFGRKPRISMVTRGFETAKVAISPGIKYPHYAPDTPLFLFDGDMNRFRPGSKGGSPKFAFIGSRESCKKISGLADCKTIDLGSRGNMYEIAKNLYDGLIRLDSLRVDMGIVESFGESGIGLAIMNRIRKATSNRIFTGFGAV